MLGDVGERETVGWPALGIGAADADPRRTVRR